MCVYISFVLFFKKAVLETLIRKEERIPGPQPPEGASNGARLHSSARWPALQVDSKWNRRKYSMMWNPIPSATSAESLQASLLDAIPEVDPEQMQWEYYGVRP